MKVSPVYITLRIQVCPKKGISPRILFCVWILREASQKRRVEQTNISGSFAGDVLSRPSLTYAGSPSFFGIITDNPLKEPPKKNGIPLL